MMKQRIARKIRRARATLKIPVHILASSLRAMLEPNTFDDVKCVCLFIGHARSGHSVFGSLLDAHPSMVIAHEMNALRYARLGFRRKLLFDLMVRKSKDFSARGRAWSGYSAQVQGQWQGRWRTLRVVGDKKGSGTCWELRNHPELLDVIQERVGCPIRWIHVIRNPFDNISTMYDKRLVPSENLSSVADHYFLNCETVRTTRSRMSPDSILDMWHEDFIANPQNELREACRFLGVEADDDYLRACADIVFKEPKRSRDGVEWDRETIAKVEAGMSEYPHLHRYSFDG